MLWKKVKQNQSGQAITEFVLGLMIMISFFFFFIKLAAVFVIGNYIHYATFMSARTFMSSNENYDLQKTNAEDILKKMVGNKWKNFIKPDASSTSGGVPGGMVGPGTIQQDDPKEFWNEGSTYSFIAKLSLYPWNVEGQGIDLKLKSESWMPREQSEDECIATKQKIFTQLKSLYQDAGMEWENGC